MEYWVGAGDALDFDGGPKGEWKAFPSGVVNNAQGGTSTLKLADTPVSTRFLRVLMTESSNTCDEHGSGDVRNCVGYAIQQIAAGTVDRGGAFLGGAERSRRKANHVLRFVHRSLAFRRRRVRQAAATSTAASIFSSPAD